MVESIVAHPPRSASADAYDDRRVASLIAPSGVLERWTQDFRHYSSFHRSVRSRPPLPPNSSSMLERDLGPTRERASVVARPLCYGPMPGSNIGRTSDSPSKPGQYFRCNSMNSVAIRIASALESVFRIAHPPMTSLLSENGPSVTVILPLASRTRTPSLLGRRPPVSTRVPSLSDFSTNLPIASIKACGGGDWRYDSGWRMKVRYFMAPPQGLDHATNEPTPDRQVRSISWSRRAQDRHRTLRPGTTRGALLSRTLLATELSKNSHTCSNIHPQKDR